MVTRALPSECPLGTVRSGCRVALALRLLRLRNRNGSVAPSRYSFCAARGSGLSANEALAGTVNELKPNSERRFASEIVLHYWCASQPANIRHFPPSARISDARTVSPDAPDLVCLPQRMLRPEWAKRPGPPPRALDPYDARPRGRDYVSRKQVA
jgi:hypothetical protein